MWNIFVFTLESKKLEVHRAVWFLDSEATQALGSVFLPVIQLVTLSHCLPDTPTGTASNKEIFSQTTLHNTERREGHWPLYSRCDFIVFSQFVCESCLLWCNLGVVGVTALRLDFSCHWQGDRREEWHDLQLLSPVNMMSTWCQHDVNIFNDGVSLSDVEHLFAEAGQM